MSLIKVAPNFSLYTLASSHPLSLHYPSPPFPFHHYEFWSFSLWCLRRLIYVAYCHHLVYSSLGISLDNMDVPLSMLFSGTTTMTLLNSSLDTERTLHCQLKQQTAEVKLKAWKGASFLTILWYWSMFITLNKSSPNSNKIYYRLQSKANSLQVAHAQ